MSERIGTYAEFWPHYLREHSKPETRRLHFAGTGAGVCLALLAAVAANPWLLLLALVAGYGPAWIGHFFIENNRPATFTHPLWSLVSDFRMFWCWITGSLPGELSKAGVK